MDILIVDDNANNRMILKLLLEDYQEEKEDYNFYIDEAGDGLEAVEKCKNKDFDIVLMDIMMPNMDGIEATKIIRQAHPNIMIIAVSAVDDSARQKMILNNGAEDYISKPINSDIFISRISNYITLINARKHKKKNVNKINVFTEKIYSRHTNFMILSEDSLSEFWEFFLLNAEDKYDNLSDIVRTAFSIAETQIKLSINSSIYIEESDDYQYFTITGIDAVPAKIIELIIKKNKLSIEYKIKDDKISFELLKICSDEQIEKKQQDVVVPEIVSAPVISDENKSKELQVFNYMDLEDLDDLEEFTAKLNSLMLVVSSGDISDEEIEEMYTYLERIGSVLATYSEVYAISKALTLLSHELANHIDEFKKYSEALGPLCQAFARDMSSWIQQSFKTGAPSIDFMNDTISVNCETISGMLKIDEAVDDSEEALDDIFDF